MGSLTLAENSLNIEDAYIKLPNGSYVREDYFDDLDDASYNELLKIIEPSEMMGEDYFLSSAADRRARRDARRAARTERIKAGGGFANVVKNVAKGAASIFGGAAPDFDDAGAAADQRGVMFDVDIQSQRRWYQNPAVIIGGIALLGAGIYFASRKKK